MLSDVLVLHTLESLAEMLEQWEYQFGIALLVSEGMLIFSNTQKLTILFKAPAQRTPGEKKLVSRGLGRQLFLAGFLFVPVSVIVGSLIVRPVIGRGLPSGGSLTDALVGLVSYGFPYASVKAWVIRTSARFLRDAADVADKAVL